MEEKLIEYGDKIIAALESGIDFAGEQAPLFIQELLTYYAVENIVLMFIWILVGGVCIYFIHYILKNSNNQDSVFMKHESVYKDNSHRVMPIIFFSIIGIVSSVSFIYSLLQLIKVWISPRLFLIEKLGELL